MCFPRYFRRAAPIFSFVLAVLGLSPAAEAQDLPRVSVTRKLKIAGIGIDPHSEDVLGLSRIKFQGVIAAELTSIGYELVDESTPRPGYDAAHPPLTLVASVREEICDDQIPKQCRVAILWELQDPKGVIAYRVMTRAVSQDPTIGGLRRSLVDGALRSLLTRRRFALQLTDAAAASKPQPAGPLGFKQCRRPAMALPQASRAVAAALVFVESGSSLSGGSIISGDGLILTAASHIVPDAPLRVRFSAEQTLPAELVAVDHEADVALLHTAAHTDSTCLPLREGSLVQGAAVFGVSSEPVEDRAISLNGSLVQNTVQESGPRLLQVDPRIARLDGAPLLDEEGRLAAVVSAHVGKRPSSLANAVDASAALRALDIAPATISDPRLTDTQVEPLPAIGYVRDRDDPPFVLVKRYTYGTGPVARRMRTVGLVTAGVGAFGVAATWLNFRAEKNVSASGHHRAVILNDVSWVLFGLGVVGFGASYAVPEGHDLVGVQTAGSDLFVAAGLGGVCLGGHI